MINMRLVEVVKEEAQADGGGENDAQTIPSRSKRWLITSIYKQNAA